MKKRNDNQNDLAAKGFAALGKIGLLILNFALIYGLLRLIIAISVKFNAAWIYYLGTIVYAAAFVALFLAFFVLNGFSFSKDMRSADELPEKWSDEKKADFLAKQPERKAKAKKLIYLILPLVLTVIMSYIELNFFG